MLSFGIYELVLLLIFAQWTQAATIKDTTRVIMDAHGPECALRLKEMGIKVKLLEDSCMCEDNACGCCFESSWPESNNKDRFCINGTFISEDFEIQINSAFNEQGLGTFVLSGKNPPPLCFPVPFPIPIPLTMCIRARDIYPEENNMHLCVDILMKFAGMDFFHLPLNCMWIGADGVQFGGQK